MAYMSQEKKAQIAPVVKAICAKHGVKATLAVRHHSTLVLNISAGKIDFFADLVWRECDHEWQKKPTGSLDINPYWYDEHYTGAALAFFEEIFPALNAGNPNRSDYATDYHDVGWYVDVNVGHWNKPYVLDVGPYHAQNVRIAMRGPIQATVKDQPELAL